MARHNTTIAPPLKWAGGKRWLIPQLATIWSKHKNARLVEPFCGGLSVSLGLQPQTALLNDVNSSLINFYEQIKKGLHFDILLNNTETVYYQHRTKFNILNAKGRSKNTTAQLFYYLNRTGYNGLCRFNKSGNYNVPFGRYKNNNYLKDFSKLKTAVTYWDFSHQDFSKLNIKSGDFIYADPPYDVPFRQYSQDGFEWNDQVRLTKWLIQYNGPVVLSNQATPRIKELYQDFGFKLRYIDAPRRISCKGNKRKNVKEVLALRKV